MSGQNTLITLADDAQVKRPGGVQISRQFYRDRAAQGAGTYKAMDENGNIEIVGGPGAGMGTIGGGGTLNFISKFNPDGTTIGDSSLFDDGNVGYGTVTPNAVAAFDIVSTTKGLLIPRMTTVQRDAIAVGATTDGLLIFNTTTEKFNFWNQTLGIWESIDTSTGGDVSGSGTTGQLPVWTDGPNSIIGDSGILATNVFVNGGNSFGAPAVLGTNDANSLSFETSGTTRQTISATGFIGFNAVPVAGQLMTAVGTGATSATYLFRGYNSTPIEIFSVRNDGYIYAGIANGSMTIGLGSGFLTTNNSNTFIGVSIATGLTTGQNNTSVGHLSLEDLTTGFENSAFGSNAAQSNTTGQHNNAFGVSALQSNLIGGNNCAFGNSALAAMTASNNSAFGHECLMTSTGPANSGFGYQCLRSAQNFGNSAFGFQAMFSTTTGTLNTAIGAQAGFNNLVGNNNIFVGYFSGAYETASNAFYVNNQDRTNTANDKSLSLMYGTMAATTAAQFLRLNANVGILTNTFGTNADGVLAIANGVAPTTSPANEIQIFSVDTDDATTSLGLRAEQVVVAEAVVSDATLKITYNGTIYKICLKA